MKIGRYPLRFHTFTLYLRLRERGLARATPRQATLPEPTTGGAA